MIDLTLNSIMIPDITGYTPPFGKKKSRDISNSNGGLTTREVNNNIIAPFSDMRGVIVSINEETSELQHDAKLYINAEEEITLTIRSASYIGCSLTIINLTEYEQTLVCTSVTQASKVLLPYQQLELIWNGTAWVNISAPPIGKIIVQYPKEKAPKLLYPCTSWEEVTYLYGGAFFRTYEENVSDEFIEEGETLTPQVQGTAVNGLRISWSSGETESNTTNPTFNGGRPEHVHYFRSTQHGGSYDYRKSSDSYTYDYFPHKLSTTTTTATVSLSGGTSGSHNHSMSPAGTIGSDSSETRPDNYAIKMWRRIA